MKRMGLEEVYSHFHDGVDVSRQDLLRDKDVPTTRLFYADTRVRLPIIQAAVEVPPGFGQVQLISPLFFDDEVAIRIDGENGFVTSRVDWTFLMPRH